ncbi:MAG: winged helix-turn-helix domain-containing protein [Terriglobia bacterium]
MESKTAEITGTEIKGQVGETAGQVWNTLTTDGPMTLTQLKKKLNGQGDLLGYALGWLAREDKIDMVLQKKTLRLRLR